MQEHLSTHESLLYLGVISKRERTGQCKYETGPLK